MQEEGRRKLEEEHRRLEEAARQQAEEQAQREAAERWKKEREEEELKIRAQAEDAFAIIGDLDNALKAFQGALGLDVSGWLAALYCLEGQKLNQLINLASLILSQPLAFTLLHFQPAHTIISRYIHFTV